MFKSYLMEKISAKYEKKLLLWDDDHILWGSEYIDVFKENEFQIVRYTDDLEFRRDYGIYMCDSKYKLVIIAESHQYVPYDIQKGCYVKYVTISHLFTGLTLSDFMAYQDANLDMLTLAYLNTFEPLGDSKVVKEFFCNRVLGRDNVGQCLSNLNEQLRKVCRGCKNYDDWFRIAEKKAEIDRLAAQYQLMVDTTWINEYFVDWVMRKFGGLAGESSNNTPVLLSKAMEFIKESSEKFVLVIMDGMSEFDWSILKKSFRDIIYEKTSAFAMIPTVTSVSRQSLLSNKAPVQLLDPWSQTKEKREFFTCADELGFRENQIFYGHGYDNYLKYSIKCAAIVINDIDDMVHGQGQERIGMHNGVSVMAQSKELYNMVKRYIEQGFDVFITADHGNTPCVGLGLYRGAGVETATRSRRMMVLNSLADIRGMMDKYPLIEFPKYYLPKENTYLICKGNSSFDNKDEKVMSHGGITIDEVVVPFVKILARKNNG